MIFEIFFCENLDNYYGNDKLTEFDSNPSITIESIQNIFSEPEFCFSLNNINDLSVLKILKFSY